MFDVKLADEIMRRDLFTLKPTAEVLPSISAMLVSNISGAPVVKDDGTYLGVFSEKCCMNALTVLVEAAVDESINMPTARQFMKKELTKLTPDWNVFEAIDHILERKISGAPIVDENDEFLGVFSEKTAMRILIMAVHDSVPGASIKNYMNLDRNRVIQKETPLIDVVHKFQQTEYRRLPVLTGNKLEGQISRRDVLRAEFKVGTIISNRARTKVHTYGAVELPVLNPVDHYMDQAALTIGPRTDMLSIAQLFLNSPYRRLPVVDENRKLIGQVSRRDLLETASKLMKPEKEKLTAKTLYLSQVSGTIPASIDQRHSH